MFYTSGANDAGVDKQPLNWLFIADSYGNITRISPAAAWRNRVKFPVTEQEAISFAVRAELTEFEPYRSQKKEWLHQ